MAIDIRHNDNVTTVRTDKLQNGDINWREGYAFRVSDLRYVTHADGVRVVRFRGTLVEASDLTGTGYDNATYGARGDWPARIVRRELLPLVAAGLVTAGAK